LCIEEILKQRRAAQTAVDRPNTDALKRAREVRLKQIEMNGIIKECIVYLVFVLVVYFISYQERDFRSFLFAQNIKNQFFGGKPSFSSVSQRYFALGHFMLLPPPRWLFSSVFVCLSVCWHLCAKASKRICVKF